MRINLLDELSAKKDGLKEQKRQIYDNISREEMENIIYNISAKFIT